jgi:hypothetical protein
MAIKFREMKALKTDSIEQRVQEVACYVNGMKCMYGQCTSCKDREINMSISDKNIETTWYAWTTAQEGREIKGLKKRVDVTRKVRESGSVYELSTSFQKELRRFKMHHFNIHHQHTICPDLKNNWNSNEELLHIDFSDNYILKMARSIQSFGASQQHITLHTGVLYLSGNTNRPISFCTVSQSMAHSPGAIWAHLDPILDHLLINYPEVKKILFISDSPTTQYRQNGNLYKFSTILFEKGLGTWNFLEVGHGKGAPDGVGAALK